MAECACANLIFTSFTDIPSLICVEAKYLNWYTSSCVCRFIYMLVDGLSLMLLARILLLSELISMPHSAAKAVVLQRTMTTAGCQLLLPLPLHHLQSSHSLRTHSIRASCIIFSKNILILEIMDILVVLQMSFERSLQHFHLVAQHLLLRRTTKR